MEEGACVSVSELELLKRRAAERIDEAAERLGTLSSAIWSEPELAYEEHHAHRVLTRFFEHEPPAASWAVQPHYHLPTAFRAEWQRAGGDAQSAASRPLHLGFLCEYDALPGIGHACGHNLIAEVGAAAALGVRGALEAFPGPTPPVKVRWDPGRAPSPFSYCPERPGDPKASVHSNRWQRFAFAKSQDKPLEVRGGSSHAADPATFCSRLV